MNSNWFHELKGKYDISEKTIAIDYGKLMGDPMEARLVLVHEGAHALLSHITEMGQATHIFYKLQAYFTHLNAVEVDAMLMSLYGAQKRTQEGLATLMMCLNVRRVSGNAGLTQFLAKLQKTNPEYYGYVKDMIFITKLGLRYREFFTEKVSQLVMETGIRKHAKGQNLFKDPATLNAYLDDENNSPDKRLENLLRTLYFKPWLITKPTQFIAETVGLKFNDTSTKEEVAGFMTYAASLTAQPRTYKAEEIGDAADIKPLQDVYDNMMVSNINMNVEPSDVVNQTDFLHYADKYKIFLAILNEDIKSSDFIKSITGEEPEVLLYGFLGTGEKYVTALSKLTAEKIINNELKDITFAIKWGGFNAVTQKNIWSETLRPPELIIYNTAVQMKGVMENVLNSNPKTTFTHLYAGAMEDHPLQSLLIKVENNIPIHAVNHYGNKKIIEILDIIRSNSTVMENQYLLDNKESLNNLLSLWMGLHWEVDWVQTMVDADVLYFRK